MKLTLFTDPHLGTRRAAHTTRESAKRLQTALYESALNIVEGTPNPVCLGDLFDRSFNSEDTLLQGYNVAAHCKFTIAGNHDSTNRADTLTSIDALAEMDLSIIRAPTLSDPYWDYTEPGIYVVPHHASQELFEKAMQEAAIDASVRREGKASVLMLHCNYNWHMEIADDTLNLSEELAEQLLTSFDYIFIGHEHKPSKHLDGRVVVLGNIHPTSFSDISDKFKYTLDITDDSVELSQERIWSLEKSYLKLRVGEPLPELDGVQFVDVEGIGSDEDALIVSQYIKEIWDNGPDLLAVRNGVDLKNHLDTLDDVEPVQVVDIAARIESDLEGSDMLPLYKRLLKEV